MPCEIVLVLSEHALFPLKLLWNPVLPLKTAKMRKKLRRDFNIKPEQLLLYFPPFKFCLELMGTVWEQKLEKLIFE